MNPPNLLDGQGSPSTATMLMMVHHAFRRDAARFSKALGEIAQGHTSRIEPLQEEWKSFHTTLQGHHHTEDTMMFPDLQGKHPEVRKTVETLTADHHRMDTILERVDRAFVELPNDEAARVITELRDLFNSHFALEEAELVPFLRAAREFPPTPDANAEKMMADGVAWASQGIAPDVLEKAYTMVPSGVRDRLPAARDAFKERCRRVWGKWEETASRTPVPDNLA
jgi:hemerythrin-like domain-containing protein